MASAAASTRAIRHLTLIAAGLSACGRAAGPRQATVTVKSVEDVFLLTGELRAVRSSSVLTPRGDSLQIRWLAEDGADVREGERVAEFDPTSLIQRLEERRLRLQQAELQREGLERAAVGERERRRAALEKAEIEDQKSRLEASVPLEYREPKARPQLQAQWQQTRAALEKARLEHDAYAVSSAAEIVAARAAEQKARRELEQVEAGLRGMSLLAPRAGIFQVSNSPWFGREGPRKLQPGDNLNPGFVVGTIPDPTRMEVDARLAESDHGRIATGMSARCILDTYPDRVFWGRVEAIGSIAPEAFENRRASGRLGFAVRVSLARSEPLMRPGLSVRVEVVRGHWPRALSVPRAAVRFAGEGPFALQADRARPLRLAGCTPLDCIVESGLSEGDRVALF
jgi:multidrug efflux pump subunit AcrA (membrane-fusion protein)